MERARLNGSSHSHKSKKRKDRSSDVQSSPLPSALKKPRKDQDAARVLVPASSPVSVSKGKAKALMQDDIEDVPEFSVVQATVRVTIPPVFALDPRAGVEEMLDSMIMKHIPSLRGVVLSHSNLEFLSDSATILNDCPYMVCDVGFDATVWSPQIGMKLSAKVNLFSPDHIALLIHRTFNISIPRRHIPSDQYHFEYGPAENDPQFGPAAAQAREDADEEMKDVVQENTTDMIESMGRWVRTLTNEKVGGDGGIVHFTVIGMTLANQMISLIGSLQPDPFDPVHDQNEATAAPKVDIPSSIPTLGDSDNDSLPELDQLGLETPVTPIYNGDGGSENPKKRKKEAEEKPKKEKRKKPKTEDSVVHPPKKKKKKEKDAAPSSDALH